MLSILKNIRYFALVLFGLICAGCGTFLPWSETYPLNRQMAPFPPEPVCRVAVLPFLSDSDYPLADAIVTKVFTTQFQKSGNFLAIQEGDILKVYQQLHILPGMIITLDQLQIIADRVGARYLITGIVLEMREDRGLNGTVNPELTLEIQIRDGRSGQTLWTAFHRRQGSYYTKAMHFGAIHTVTGLSQRMAVEIINLWFKKGLTQCDDYHTILILLACLAIRPVAPASAWLFNDNNLVSIDGVNYTTDDFKHWWKYWNDNGSPLPATVDPYIDFLLLTREASRMALDDTPEFKRQTRIFLQSRALMMLKNDAVNSQIKVTEDEIKARYDEQFQPLWLVQRLEFKDEDKAMAAWQELSDRYADRDRTYRATRG